MASEDALTAYIQRRIENWLKEDPDRSASELAAAAGVTPTTISEIRSGARGVGMKALRGLARAWGTTASALEELADAGGKLRVERDHSGGRTNWGASPAWETAEKQARAKYAVRLGVPDWAWERAREIHGARPLIEATPEIVLSAAQWVQQNEPPPAEPVSPQQPSEDRKRLDAGEGEDETEKWQEQLAQRRPGSKKKSKGK